MYGEICVHFFCPPSRGVARFVQERLGHVISDEELKRGNASATQHYFHYYLIDSEGKHMGAKGVKLTEAEPLLTITSTSENQPESLPEPLPETQPIAHEPPEATNAITTLSEQVETLTQEIKRLWSHVSSMNVPASPAGSTTDTTFFTREIEGLRAQLAATQQERDQAAADLAQAQKEKEALQQQLDHTHQAYQQRIEGLTALLTQAPSLTPTTQPQPVETPATVIASRPQMQTPTPVVPVQPKPKREHSTRAGSADQRIEAAMRAVMDWNRLHESDSAKFAITQSLLQKTTGSNMPAVKRVMETFKNEIYEHNAEYALDPDRHNYGKDLEEIKQWVEARG